MAEEFQNTISFYGPLDAVEEVARLIGASLFENLESECTDEFILLLNDVEQPESPQDILDGCLVDSVWYSTRIGQKSRLPSALVEGHFLCAF